MRIVFVVLHYCQIEVTKECVNSLKSLAGVTGVVVVDNASPDKSGTILIEEYREDPSVHVFLNEKNMGFACGNNVGYLYAKKELSADCIVVLNNDTIIKDIAFVEKLNNLKDLNQYHIIGPDILTIKGRHQNPYREHPLSINSVKRTLYRKRLGVLFYSIPIIYRFRRIGKETNDMIEYTANLREGIVPHGSAVIYTSIWIKEQDFAFLPDTFMYYEEDILYYYSMSKNYKILFEPTLQIIHLEDISTNVAHAKIRERLLFQSRQKVRSLKVLLRVCSSFD